MIKKHWNRYLSKIHERDIYFTEEYVNLYGDAECFIYQENGYRFVFPYIKSRIADNELYDFETAYGYGGPLTNTGIWNETFLKKAWDEFYESCRENKIVNGFVRYHPLLQNHINAPDSVFNRKTIAIDLAVDLWEKELHPKHRNKIRIAERKGLSFTIDEKFEHLPDFVEIYNERMKTLNADESYYFSADYYKRIRDTLGEHSFLGLVYMNGMIISAGIFFHYGDYGHYHLAASRDGYLEYRPNNFLVYHAALYLKEKNIRLFHLGGGLSGDDSLYKFKARFSKSTHDFYIGKLIFDEEKYSKICSKWTKQYPEKHKKYGNYFMKYRY